MSQYKNVAFLLITVYVLCICQADGQRVSAYFGPAPNPGLDNSGSYEWIKEAILEIRKNCKRAPPPDPCKSSTCQQGGTCQPYSNGTGYTCDCPLGATGKHCEYKDTCNSTTCQQGGTCNPSSNQAGYTCDCSIGVTGKHCQYQLRLMDGRSSNEGRVEIYSEGIWGTVCHNNWDLRDADVVCRQLGYSKATHAWPRAFFGVGNGPYLLTDVSCAGSESNLFDCGHSTNLNECGQSEQAGATCGNSTMPVAGSCSSYVDAGATTRGEFSIKPPCDPSPEPILPLCEYVDLPGALGAQWWWLLGVNHGVCKITGNWTSERLICTELPIKGFRLAKGENDIVRYWVIGADSCSSLTFHGDFLADVINCHKPNTAGWSWGNEVVLMETVCSTDGNWSGGSFSGCGDSTEVNVTISVRYGQSDYGTFVLSCYDGSSWLELSSVFTGDTQDHFFYIYISN